MRQTIEHFLLNEKVSNGPEQFGINGNNEKIVRE